jgi:hypothetical protein
MKKSRQRDVRHTSGLSKKINAAERKALRAKERQQGKKREKL